ncbi:MAG: PilT/PilU family type 4a pilus ATPase [Acidimicrobiales bacterium]|jgi:twitching motility protein PilT
MSPERRTSSNWSKRLAETLVDAGKLPSEAATTALSEAADLGRPVAAVLTDKGLVESAVSLAELARIAGMTQVDIAERQPMGEAFRLVPERLARELCAIGYKLDSTGLTMACAEPLDQAQQREIAGFLGIEVAGCVLADAVAIERLMDAVYPRLSSGEETSWTPPPEPVEPVEPNEELTDISLMDAPTETFESIVNEVQFEYEAPSNLAPDKLDTADDWQADYGVDVRRTPPAPALGGVQELQPFKPTLNPDGSMDIDELLIYAVRNGASDLHLANQLPPAIRIDGSLRPIAGLGRVNNEQIREMVYRILTQGLRERFEAERELDTAHTIMGVGRFRVNVFQQRGSIGTVMRAIPHEIPPFDTLGLPPIIPSLAELRRGLVLVTGPTGSGKSTTLASLVNIINQTKPLHIITVEDPIEFLHTHSRSIVNQREVGADTKSFAEALRHVLRQDPDVILIGEMRDTETIATALTAAETGHLVFATLHTQDAPQTIDRIVDVFPSGQQDQVRIQLAGSLEAVVTQQLVLSASGFGRTPVAEVMLCNPAIRNLIRSSKTHQIYSLIQTGASVGMQTMDQGLAKAVQEGRITEAMAFDRCHDPSELRDYLRQR